MDFIQQMIGFLPQGIAQGVVMNGGAMLLAYFL